GKPVNQAIGHGYFPIQVIVDAIERAGTLDKEKVNQALATTDVLTMNHRVVYDKENHFSRIPIFFGQWMKVDKPWKWELKVVFSKHDFVKEEAKPLFPIP
ncbi:MAG: transporter substrate-binding protein, partial [Deltaproteobacteria bacterium]|nr:transporter substrate-binding protein [Deltaproteobacteria bacterium]